MRLRKRTKRAVVASVLAMLALACAGSLVAVPIVSDDEVAAQRAKRPNIVVVMTDDQHARSMSVMDQTRQLLGRQGATFRNAFATFPLCCPSRATYFTGQYAHNHGVVDNSGPNGGYQAFNDRRTLPVALKREGYRTAYLGKYLNGYTRPGVRGEVPNGWTLWNGTVDFGGMFDYRISENGRLRRYGNDPRDYLTDVLARRATGFIRRSSRGSRPFFMTVAPLAPHVEKSQRGEVPNPRPAPRDRGAFRSSPLPTPPSFNERDVSDKPAFVRSQPRLDARDRGELRRKNRDRLASLLAVDDAVKWIVGALRRTGELRNTVVIFTSDNGWLLGEHRLDGKIKLFEESAQVPLVMRGPGIPVGVTRSQLAGNIDLAPTILDIADARPLRTVDGQSLLPLARNPGAGEGRELLLENRNAVAVRTPRYMYAEHDNGGRELYDLLKDPFQLESRHDDPGLASVRARLAERLRELEDCAGAGCR